MILGEGAVRRGSQNTVIPGEEGRGRGRGRYQMYLPGVRKRSLETMIVGTDMRL